MNINDGTRTNIVLERKELRAPATLLLGGFITHVLVTLLHTGGPANHHQTIFEDYAGSHDWAVVHLGQFAAMAVIVAGFVLMLVWTAWLVVISWRTRGRRSPAKLSHTPSTPARQSNDVDAGHEDLGPLLGREGDASTRPSRPQRS